MLCWNSHRAGPSIRYADLGSRTAETILPTFLYGLKRMRQLLPSDTPITCSNCGTSLCQPMGAPGEYSVTTDSTMRSAGTPIHSAHLAFKWFRNSGMGGAASALRVL